MINEALAEEVRREEKKRRRSDRKAAEVTEAASSAPAALGPRESPIEPDPNPKGRLIMKSASTTASGSRQEGGRRVISEDDSRMQKPDVGKEEESRTTWSTVDKHPKKNCSDVLTESCHHMRSC